MNMEFWEPANDSELRYRLKLNGFNFVKPMHSLSKIITQSYQIVLEINYFSTHKNQIKKWMTKTSSYPEP